MRIISGEFRNRIIKMPNSRDVRPTSQKVRKAIFDVLSGVVEGKKVLDLFSGSGALGFEALSVGAEYVTFVEKNPISLKTIQENIELLNVRAKCTVIARDALDSLDIFDQQKAGYDIVFADPPYIGGWAKKCLLKISSCDILLAPAIVVIEHYKKDELPTISNNLKRWQLKNYGDTLISFYTHS
ncbi:MAG: 16S rRNA (guanine(966)-N(2))-methyltransferase RsmD [Candidatus Omnitrophica bacterium]|nr:16S rRNA (guanine(966)-N(2))-methyltransferase RsmD [Candidatus Omnitrophota bacterium]